ITLSWELACRADLTGDGSLGFFDFLEFQTRFATGDMTADFSGDGLLDFFDFLAFQNEFAAGCI
ncbi:MAG: GC-type dockerin domain-anchored protein, partial [Phycisphaerales bacterium JB039]